MRRSFIAKAALLIGLAACTENSAIGNDREAQLDPLEPPAERAPASSLAQLDPDLLKPEAMTESDLASLSLGGGTCVFRYTQVGFPVFVYPAGGAAAAKIKLNGKLIDLQPTGGSAYADGVVRVEMNHPDGLPTDGQMTAELILRFDGVSDELGFRGAANCQSTP